MPTEPETALREEFSRWRGGIEARMTAFDINMSEIHLDLRELRKTSADNNSMLLSLLGKQRDVNGGTQNVPVTFKWILEKLAIPLLLAVNAVILGLVLTHVLQ
jgi:hypothetical protein